MNLELYFVPKLCWISRELQLSRALQTELVSDTEKYRHGEIPIFFRRLDSVDAGTGRMLH